MGYLYWKDGRMQTPPCSSCGSSQTSEEQETIEGKIRNIYLKCYSCGEKKFIGKYEYLGGHSFRKV